MRFSTLTAKTVRLIDVEDASSYVGGPHIFGLLKAHKWIKPVVEKHRLTRYDVEDLDAAINRMKKGEFPGE